MLRQRQPKQCQFVYRLRPHCICCDGKDKGIADSIERTYVYFTPPKLGTHVSSSLHILLSDGCLNLFESIALVFTINVTLYLSYFFNQTESVIYTPYVLDVLIYCAQMAI